MTVNELISALQYIVETNEEDGDMEVVVRTEDRGFPATPCVRVKYFTYGFDWNAGKLMLQTEPGVVKVPKAALGGEGAKRRGCDCRDPECEWR